MVVGMGTYVNTATVVAGALLGLLAGRHVPERLRQTITGALGLITIFIAIRMMSDIDRGYTLHVVGALLAGAIIGELLKIEQGLEWLGGWLRERFAAKDGSGQATFVEGFVVASLIFCVGPMTILGTFEDGVGNWPMLLMIKSTMDGVLAIALAASLGRGVLFSAFFILLFQGLLTAVAWLAAPQVPPLYLSAISSTGGVMILAIGLLLLGICRLRIANLLPALPLVCLILWLWPKTV